MEDGLERCRHSLHSRNERYFETPDEKPIKTLYVCSPSSDKFELNKCIITNNKEKMQELMKQKYNVSVFLISETNNTIYNYLT